MKNQYLPSILLILIISAMIIPGSTSAASLKERMKDRLPQIVKLKAEGVIGENNRGFLEMRQKNATALELITAENRDRQTVYNAIAKQQQVNPEIVGQRRAAQIASRAASNTWLQNSQGEWYKKKL